MAETAAALAMSQALGISVSFLGGSFQASVSHAALVALLSSPAVQALLVAAGIAIIIVVGAIVIYYFGTKLGYLKGNDD